MAEATRIRSILVPLDGSPLGDRALEDAAAIARAFDASITLLSVIAPPSGAERMARSTGESDAELERRHEETRSHLARAAAALGEHGIAVHTLIYAMEQPALAILDVARGNGVDLIAMSTHGRGGVSRLVLGSVAERVLREAPCAVLVRPPASRVVEQRGRD